MLSFDLIQFDSYGAKSSCVKIVTPDIKIVIDPGVAIMHPTFPADIEDKYRWLEEGWERVYKALDDADIIIVTHYHYDHHIPDDPRVYGGRKAVFIKNPNIYINDSQRERAMHLLNGLSNFFGIELNVVDPTNLGYLEDVADELSSTGIDFGDYNERRKELLRRGREWFNKRRDNWFSSEYIDEIFSSDLVVIYPEASKYRFGETIIRFSGPLFHGIEYSRVGWVYSVLIEYRGYKLFFSSDLNGPIIEDYADMVIRENPQVIIMDGPMTYMFGYTLNRINLNRCIKNMVRIIDSVEFDVLIWDHHLPREKRFRERTNDVWSYAAKKGREVLTAREYKYGKPPVVEEL